MVCVQLLLSCKHLHPFHTSYILPVYLRILNICHPLTVNICNQISSPLLPAFHETLTIFGRLDRLLSMEPLSFHNTHHRKPHRVSSWSFHDNLHFIRSALLWRVCSVRQKCNPKLTLICVKIKIGCHID